MTTPVSPLPAAAYAHRGLWSPDGAAENSLAAFRLAMEAGVGFECDVRRAGDGRWVVFHDDHLDRLTGLSGRVRDAGGETLAGARLPDGSSLPSLEAVLKLAFAGASVLIELKVDDDAGDDDAEDLAASLSRAVGSPPGAVAFMTFHPVAAAALARARPLSAVGRLVAPAPIIGEAAVATAAAEALASGCRFLAPHLTSLAATANAAPGAPLAAWTVSDPALLALARAHAARPIFERFPAALAIPAGDSL